MYCILPTSAAEAVPIQVYTLLGITIFAPFCSLGLCQTQTHSLFNMLVSSQQALSQVRSKVLMQHGESDSQSHYPE
jgi:hypothetical protein